MNSSPEANIVDIRRFIQHFDDSNITLFKQCLFNETGCENEKEWLCYIVRFLSQSMTPQSIATLRNKSIEIAQTQRIKYNANPENTQKVIVTSSKDSSISLYKWIQRQYNDKLSRLPSDIIDHIGLYLSKTESISIGYLNKQLYIETQKQSYLSKQWNDKALILNDKTMSRFLWKESNPFSYSMPTQLHVAMVESSLTKIFSSHWFTKMFSRLNGFRCCTFECLPCVPLNVFFG